MESLSIGLSASLPFQNSAKIQNPVSKSILPVLSSPPTVSSTPKKPQLTLQTEAPICQSRKFQKNPSSLLHFDDIFLRTHFYFLSMGFFFPLSCCASEGTTTMGATQDVSNKINLEALVSAVDEFLTKNPFFVSGVTFIWLVVVPLAKAYFRKYKFISAIDAFRKLRDDPNCQLLDIRDKKSLEFLNSPNLKILNKSVLQVEFSEGGDEEGFVKQVLGSFHEPQNTIICIIDNFDGNSMKVAELLAKNGFKEAYAIRGGIRGNKGWQEIQETLLPPSVHIKPRKRVRVSKEHTRMASPNQDSGPPSATDVLVSPSEETSDGSIKNFSSQKSGTKFVPRSSSSSPYPNYPDLKPPSSPTPSKPER